jgi:antirestriction protein ArdC
MLVGGNSKSNASRDPQQLISQSVQHLIEQLQNGKSETLTSYLCAMARFHKYSFGNILLIATQRPNATRVAGIHTWSSFGRHVKKGEKGIQILAPLIRNQRSNAPEDIDERGKSIPYGFRAVHVFDVSQTEGEELPAPATVSGDVQGYRDRLVEFVVAHGIQLEYDESIAPALGVSKGGHIVLLPGQNKAEEFATLAHEVAHELLEHANRHAETTKTVRETEAEAVSFIVCSAIGLEIGSASADYILLYNGNVETMTTSLMTIQQTASTLLKSLLA